MGESAPILIIFGITGDLSKRKLLPALYHLFSQQLLPAETKLICISRHTINIDELLGSVELCVLEEDNVCDPAGIARLKSAIETLRLDPDKAADFKRLSDQLHDIDPGNSRNRLFYMSIPPDAYGKIVEQLGGAGLNGPQSRLLIEKPFGYDYASAQQLIQLVNDSFTEDQIYRIDHYLAKETAQNVLDFRSFNPVFLPLWNSEHIERVEIRAYETLGIENRAAFYETTGALRDLIQSHMLQLLAITLMDVPVEMTSQQIHRSKQYFLEQLQPAKPEASQRGQYETYRKEVNNPKSSIETYARVSLEHAAERWAGVEIVLETGKALRSKTTEIVVSFKTPVGRPANKLVFRLQPNEGISFDIVIKQPGFDNTMHYAALAFDYESTFKSAQHIDAYERVLMDAVRGDQALFASQQEVLATWHVLDPLVQAWKNNTEGLQLYSSGTDPANLRPKAASSSVLRSKPYEYP